MMTMLIGLVALSSGVKHGGQVRGALNETAEMSYSNISAHGHGGSCIPLRLDDRLSSRDGENMCIGCGVSNHFPTFRTFVFLEYVS